MTTTINLLPWREELRKQQQQEFVVLLVLAAVLGAVVWFGWSSAVNARISDQQNRISYIEKELAQLDDQIEEIKELEERRSELVERMQVIQDLQGNRPTIVYLFDQLARTLPDGVHYNKVSRKSGVFSISGIAESNNRISRLMRNLEESSWFESPNLQTVTAAGDEENEEANQFSLTVREGSPRSNEDDGEGES